MDKEKHLIISHISRVDLLRGYLEPDNRVSQCTPGGARHSCVVSALTSQDVCLSHCTHLAAAAAAAGQDARRTHVKALRD